MRVMRNDERGDVAVALLHDEARDLQQGMWSSSLAHCSWEAGRLAALSWPLCLEQLLSFGSVLITLAMVGRLGGFPLSVLVLATAVTDISGLSLVVGMAGAVDTFCSQAFGARQHRLLGTTLQRALLINLAACLPPILLWTISGRRLLWWAEDTHMAAAAMQYARLWSPVLVLHGSSACVHRYLVAQGITKPALLAGGLSCLAAFPANWLFIFRLSWGLHGSIAASIVSEAAYLAVLLASALVSSALAPPEERPLTGLSKGALLGWGGHLRVAGPAAAMVMVEWWAYDIANLVAGVLPQPETAVAVTGLTLQLNTLLWMVPNALGMATCTYVGNALGAGQTAQAKLAVQAGLGLVTTVMAASTTGLLLSGTVIFRIFTSDRRVVETSQAVVGPLTASVTTCGAAVVLQGVLRGTGRQLVGAVTDLLAYYAFGLPVILALALKAKLRVGGLWWTLCAAAYLQMLMLLGVVVHFDWAAEARRTAGRVRPAA